MTNSESARLSWNKAPIGGLWPDFHYCQTVAGLLMWGALSDERAGLLFTIAAGPCQPSHSLVRVLWASQPYLTVSDSRVPFSSPATTHRATMEVFDTTFTRDKLTKLKVKVKNWKLLYDWRFTANQFVLASSSSQVKITLRLTVSQSILVSSSNGRLCGAPSLTRGQICLLSASLGHQSPNLGPAYNPLARTT
jgi:hypothetical protein